MSCENVACRWKGRISQQFTQHATRDAIRSGEEEMGGERRAGRGRGQVISRLLPRRRADQYRIAAVEMVEPWTRHGGFIYS